VKVSLEHGVYVVRDKCEWCGARYKRECASLRDANRARYCSQPCHSQYLASRRKIARPEERPLAVTRPRVRKIRSDARLDHAKIRAAWVAYQAGWSTYKLAEMGWQKWGFASSSAARTALSSGFRLEGYKLRSYKEAHAIQPQPETCRGCGCALNDRTQGCRTCHSRHFDRKQRKNPYLPYKPAKTGCSSCGCHVDMRTKGCNTCRTRHSWRKHNQRPTELREAA
jgi:hypothetical protein